MEPECPGLKMEENMLPDPKNVANGIRHIFRSKEEKQRAVENERDLKLRSGKNHIQSHITRQREMIPRLRGLAKRALAMGEEARFRQIGKQLIWTEQDIKRWEKYTLTLDLMQARRDQVRASASLLGTVKVMADSMADLAGTADAAQLQQELDRSMAQAASMDERIGIMMSMVDATLDGGIPIDESAFETLRDDLGEEIVSQESGQLDREIETGLENIRSQLIAEKGDHTK
jgi:hypothetical protein